MRHLTSNNIDDLAAIHEDDVELVTISTNKSEQLVSVAEQLLAERRLMELQWEQDADDVEATRRELAAAIKDEYSGALTEELSATAETLHRLFDCQRVRMRLETLTAPMCIRFHADHVPCRMLTTVTGPGTEWIAHKDVDPVVFADRTSDDVPLRNGGEIRQLATGHWSMLKGGRWQDQYCGVVHRSPHQPGARLLLAVDPILST